ncbi:MAG: NAD(P)H-hydrate epimerase [Fuerstiella sp.]|nr:NAD(P)H-hydrate epimerase [Fuerstiella sp.]MCP4507791.1 NAD(P)H-hydrate epimerase [Fuerstiella sp.]
MTDYPVLSRDQARQVDAAAMEHLGLPSLLLMENAARGVTEVLLRNGEINGQILILCGPGNNGGDGLAIARLLASVGVAAAVYLVRTGKALTDDANHNLSFLLASGGIVKEGNTVNDWEQLFSELTDNDWILDCLLGTGVSGGPRPPFSAIIKAVNGSSARVLAVDVPSGLNCDTGAADGICTNADATVTFVGMKQGFQRPSASQFTGEVTVAHIGIPLAWVHFWLSDCDH